MLLYLLHPRIRQPKKPLVHYISQEEMSDKIQVHVDGRSIILDPTLSNVNQTDIELK